MANSNAVLAPRKIQRFGWKPDLPDIRDLLFVPEVPELELPPSVDLRGSDTPVIDQGQLGSCVDNAGADDMYFVERKQGDQHATLGSRLFMYYNVRALEGTVDSDSGSTIRDAMTVLAKLGIPPETEWPYDIAKFTQKPPTKAYQDGLQTKPVKYLRVGQTLAAMQSCLAQGYPFLVGFTVYDSFESDAVARTGVVPMPAKGEGVLGGHCTRVMGYDNASQRFLLKNSWGPSWGMQGYFTMPYAYLTNRRLANDFWTIRLIQDQGGAA